MNREEQVTEVLSIAYGNYTLEQKRVMIEMVLDITHNEGAKEGLSEGHKLNINYLEQA